MRPSGKQLVASEAAKRLSGLAAAAGLVSLDTLWLVRGGDLIVGLELEPRRGTLQFARHPGQLDRDVVDVLGLRRHEAGGAGDAFRRGGVLFGYRSHALDDLERLADATGRLLGAIKVGGDDRGDAVDGGRQIHHDVGHGLVRIRHVAGLALGFLGRFEQLIECLA